MIARTGRRELVSSPRVDELLGKRKNSELWSGVGVVNGMAYTESGGRVLTVEALQFRCGPQQVKVTGQLGEVMR
jgi:ATP-dependent Lon protease